MKLKKKRASYWSMLPVIFALAWPTMLEQMMQTAVQYIDTAMVGAIGTYATAAVGATSTVTWLITSSITALSIGFLSYIAQAYGAGDKERARRATSQAILTTLVVGTAFTALVLSLSALIPVWMQVDPAIQTLAAQYFFVLYIPMLPRTANIILGTVLRAIGDTKTPMRVGFIMNGINIVLNFLLIYPSRGVFGLLIPGAGLGVVGAAIASAVSYTVGGIWITAKVWKHPDISPAKHFLKPDRMVLLPCLKIAIPNMLQRFGTSLGYVAFASMINSLGEISTAAHTIANTVESAFYIPGFGMQTAAATLAGNALGAQNNSRMKDLTRMLVMLEALMMIVSGSLLFIFAPNMMHLFSNSAEVIMLGALVLRMVAVSEPFYGVSIVLEGVLQGVGKTMAPFAYNIFGMWGVRIVGTFICIHFLNYGLAAAWSCMIAHNMLLFMMFTVHYLRGKWNPLNAKNRI